jgi:hypothetical protein
LIVQRRCSRWWRRNCSIETRLRVHIRFGTFHSLLEGSSLVKHCLEIQRILNTFVAVLNSCSIFKVTVFTKGLQHLQVLVKCLICPLTSCGK